MCLKITYKISLLCLSFLLGCKSTRSIHFQSEIPFQIESPYYEPWTAGVKGGGSGINVLLPINNLNGIIPDSIHFRGYRVKATYDNQMIIGYFKTPHNQHQDVILSNEPLAEAKNQLLPTNDPSPFELENNTCVLSYTIENQQFFFKIKNLTKRTYIPYPRSHPTKP